MEVEYTERRIERRDKRTCFWENPFVYRKFSTSNQSGLSSLFYFHLKTYDELYMHTESIPTEDKLMT